MILQFLLHAGRPNPMVILSIFSLSTLKCSLLGLFYVLVVSSLSRIVGIWYQVLLYAVSTAAAISFQPPLIKIYPAPYPAELEQLYIAQKEMEG